MDRTGVGTVCLWMCAVVCLTHGRVNVATGKTYNQSSKWLDKDSSSWAANGNTDGEYTPGGGNCIHTASNGDLNPWWEVDLGRTYPVHEITVWARTDYLQRLYPLTITVDDQTCAVVISSTNREKSVTCTSTFYGQTVRLTRHDTEHEQGDDRTLNLCEVKIWVEECQDGSYRYRNGTCVPCSINCQGKSCDTEKGTCSECVSGRYGDQCSKACSRGCQGNCEQQTGYCQCKAGYRGDTCSECDDRFFNSSGICVHCSTQCLYQLCEKSTGKCRGCVSGRYGDQCSTLCSPGCQNSVCVQQSGHCSCKSGYSGDTCTECADGHYNISIGICASCSAGCGASGCDKQTGACYGCVDGYHGANCTFLCQTVHCLRCDQDTGACTQCAAKRNLLPPECTDCLGGYYKRPDSTGCQVCKGICKSGTVCDQTTGFCIHCPPGKQGLYCSEDEKDSDSTVNTPVIVGAVVGTGLFIGLCILVLAVVL